LTEDIDWFKDEKKPTGGCCGACIGVSSIEKALTLYKDVLGYDTIIYDETAEVFPDLQGLAGGSHKMRRVFLKPAKPPRGAFSPILGQSRIELFQVLDRTPEKIFRDRFWGDLGFIHLCFDIQGMDSLREVCKYRGFPFTVYTEEPFDMGGAVGMWSYLEDPDGTLIEFVETHKIPIIKKIGWYKCLQKRDPEKPLPRWMLKALTLNRVKNIPDVAETQQ
jgi:catechol 2,3-dioxygenase-like lactoylglutathione lyase family enzyme